MIYLTAADVYNFDWSKIFFLGNIGRRCNI